MADVCSYFVKAANGNQGKTSLQLVIQESTTDSALKSMAKVYSMGYEIG
jgi:hypothetical protein